MTESVFRGGIEFLENVGVYDVVLPFLLVFTLTYALLEKTKILGLQKDPNDPKGPAYPKRNLNSMVAFVIAFFVIASSQLVALINTTISQIFILLLLGVMFMLVAGTFGKDEEFDLPKPYKNALTFASLIAIILIFLNATGWLTTWYQYLSTHWSNQVVSSLILIVFIGVFIYLVTKPVKAPKKSSDK
jgi:small-conductance mechanosensitive channel